MVGVKRTPEYYRINIQQSINGRFVIMVLFFACESTAVTTTFSIAAFCIGKPNGD